MIRIFDALHWCHKSSSPLILLHHFNAGTAPAQSVRRRHNALHRRSRPCRSCVRIRAAAEAVRTQRPADTAGADTAAVRPARSHNCSWRPKLCKLCPPGGPASVPSGQKVSAAHRRSAQPHSNADSSTVHRAVAGAVRRSPVGRIESASDLADSAQLRTRHKLSACCSTFRGQHSLQRTHRSRTNSTDKIMHQKW